MLIFGIKLRRYISSYVLKSRHTRRNALGEKGEIKAHGGTLQSILSQTDHGNLNFIDILMYRLKLRYLVAAK
jgi:hypothetical protein